MLDICIKVFDQEQWARNFLEYGEMKVSHVTVMQDIEDKARQDMKEGYTTDNVVVRIGEKVSRIMIKDSHYIDLDKAAANGIDLRGEQRFLKISYTPDCYLYSFAHITENSDEIQCRFNELKKFGDYAVIISDYREFIRRVRNSIPDAKAGIIQYKQQPSSIFEKAFPYQYESEERIIFNGSDSRDKILFKRVGSIKDIAYYCKTNQFDELAEMTVSAVDILNKKINF